MLERKIELWIAVGMMLFGLVAALIWIPADTQTPAIYTFRRQTLLGDAFLPMLAAGAMALFGALQLIVTWRRARYQAANPPMDGGTLAFFAMLGAVLAVSLVLMFWAGPAVWALFGDGSGSYRTVRGEAPWKYIGFLIGGSMMLWGIIAIVEGRFTLRRLIVSVIFTALLILLFGVPFDTLMLPPNGDW